MKFLSLVLCLLFSKSLLSYEGSSKSSYSSTDKKEEKEKIAMKRKMQEEIKKAKEEFAKELSESNKVKKSDKTSPKNEGASQKLQKSEFDILLEKRRARNKAQMKAIEDQKKSQEEIVHQIHEKKRLKKEADDKRYEEEKRRFLQKYMKKKNK